MAQTRMAIAERRKQETGPSVDDEGPYLIHTFSP